MRDLFDHNVVNLAGYIVFNDRINKLGIIISVEGDICETISRSYSGIFIERLGKTCENLRQIISDSAEIRNNQLQDKIRMRHGPKQLAVLYAVFHTAAVYCTIVFKDFSPSLQTLHTREDLFTCNYKLICNRNAVIQSICRAGCK
jgi:hypothetical protein